MIASLPLAPKALTARPSYEPSLCSAFRQYHAAVDLGKTGESCHKERQTTPLWCFSEINIISPQYLERDPRDETYVSCGLDEAALPFHFLDSGCHFIS